MKCQHSNHDLSYRVGHADAERRMKDGEHQVFCTACQKWVWVSRFHSPHVLWNALCGESNKREEGQPDA